MKTNNTTIITEAGLLAKLGTYLSDAYQPSRIMIVSDSKVLGLYGEVIREQVGTLGVETYELILPQGEKNKNIDSLLNIYQELLDKRFTRDDLIIAFGGGIIGDITGLAASTFLRGISFVQIPTTLVSQADSCLGGKNGVNTKEGQNLIGTYYHPDYIWIDPNLLETINERDFNAGIAEIIKFACIADRELFENLLSIQNIKDTGIIESIIERCVEIKAEFISDKYDNDENKTLINFGHTLGHGIEQYYNYENYNHGEAIAIGMQAVTEISEAQGMTAINTSAMLREVLEKYNLPTDIPSDFDRDKLLEMTLHDKKNRGYFIDLVLLDRIGSAYIYSMDRDNLIKYIY